MRFGSLFILMFLNIVWMPLEANGQHSDAVQNPCRAGDCGPRSTVDVGLSVKMAFYPDHQNGVSELPPALRQLLAGLTATKTYAPGPRDDRPVPPNYDVGSDGFSYFLGTETYDSIQECRGYCRRFRGFRLAIAKTTETLNQMRKYHGGIVDLAIIRLGANVRLLWGDGTPLNHNIVLTSLGEPLINQPGTSDKFAMWLNGPTSILDDLVMGYKTLCLCQGSSEIDLC